MTQPWDRSPQRQTDLVRLPGPDAATTTRTVRRRENAGFVRRCPCSEAGGPPVIEPTEPGNALRGEVEKVRTDLEAGVAEGMTTTRQAEAVGVLNRIEASLVRAWPQQGRPGSARTPRRGRAASDNGVTRRRRARQRANARSAVAAGVRRAATRSSTYWTARHPRPQAARVATAPVRCASWK